MEVMSATVCQKCNSKTVFGQFLTISGNVRNGQKEQTIRFQKRSIKFFLIGTNVHILPYNSNNRPTACLKPTTSQPHSSTAPRPHDLTAPRPPRPHSPTTPWPTCDTLTGEEATPGVPRLHDLDPEELHPSRDGPALQEELHPA